MNQQHGKQRFESDREAFLEDMRGRNSLKADRLFCSYDCTRFDFQAGIRRLLQKKGFHTASDLGQLHTTIASEKRDLDADQLNEVSRSFYDTDNEFLSLYRRFIAEIIIPIFGQAIYFQATPTIRFHFPRQAGFDFLPTFHNDVMLGHPPQEVNLWIPITKSFESNAMLLMGLDDSMSFLGDFAFDEFRKKTQTSAFNESLRAKSKAVTLDPGQFVAFDSRCIHATQYNETAATRISMDVRVIPVADYRGLHKNYIGTGRMRMPFAPGHYYAAEPA